MMGFFDRFKKSNKSNFKYLDDLIHSGQKEIILDSDIVLDKKEIRKYKDGIKLDVNDLIIDGNGHSIDAKRKTGIFYCTGKNVTIKNIILKNGYTKYSGAIHNSNGELTITESTLQNNTTELYGGAIRNSSGELTITKSTLNNNTARKGGAIYIDKGKLTITKSTLTENTANDDGGAISMWDGELTITESTLNKNTAKERDGGAIYNNSSGELTITESIFNSNTAKRHGGVIRNVGEITITKSTLQNNTAKMSGGAIHNEYGGELTIHGSTLNNNTAQENGGAIYNNESGEITITQSTLIENTAKKNGGAIENGFSGRLNIAGCKILNNKSPNNIIFTKSFMEVHNTKFNNNQSKHLFVNKYPEFNISIIDCKFIGNNVEKDVICNNGKSCTIKNTIFENNLSRNITNKTDLTLISSKIKDDRQSISNDGHILIRQSPNLESKIYGDGTVETDSIIQEETFDFGHLDKKIHESKNKEIILEQDISFENYEIDYYEGGIELDMDDLVIDGNGHTIDGAHKSRIFIITGKNITLKNITFKNGVAHDNYHYHFNVSGGAIRINYNAKITIENCVFISNMTKYAGGAIINSGDLIITESTLNNNIAKGDSRRWIRKGGGAIYNNDGGELTITESTFTGNTAQGKFSNGGAIYNNDGGELTITESTFTGNTAQGEFSMGGAIFNSEGELTITKSTLTENTANYRGGAIHNSNGELTITESTLQNNTTEISGGAIYNNDGGELTITESTLTGNTARSRGGAIYHWWGKLTITGSTLTGNTAIHGGAIYLNNSKKYESNDCTFKDNNPDDVYGE